MLESGALAVAFNNRVMRERCPLSVALSDDGGRTWPWVRDLERCDGHEEEQQEARVRGDRVNYEYSSPAVRAVHTLSIQARSVSMRIACMCM